MTTHAEVDRWNREHWDGEPLPDFDKPSRTLTEQLLETIAQELFDQRTLLERLLTTERTGAVSSVSFEDMAKGEPKVCSKFYVGSPITTEDVDAVLAVHAYAHRRAAELAMNGWKDTVDMLAAAKACTA